MLASGLCIDFLSLLRVLVLAEGPGVMLIDLVFPEGLGVC